MKYLGLLLSTFRRHRLRTTLTILSIAVAFILFAYLGAIRKAFSMGVDVAGADRLVVRHRVSIIQMLPESYEADIERIPGVENAANFTWFGGIYQDPRNFFAQMAVDPDELLSIYPEYVVPKKEADAWKRTRTGAIAGRLLAERFGWKVGDRIPIQATIWLPKEGGPMWEFDLVGIYDGASQETDTTQFFFRHDYLEENRRWGSGLVGWYTIKVKDPSLAVEVAKKIDETFQNSPAETKTETEGAFVQSFADQVGNVGAITRAILGAVFFTILLVAGNTMAQSIRERLHDLGVLKAVGFTDGQVMGLVLAEAMIISMTGGALGLLLGWGMVARGDPTHGALPVFFFPPGDLVVGIAFVFLLGVVTGLMPALQALRLNPVEALRRD